MNAGDSEANKMGGVVFRFNVLDSGLYTNACDSEANETASIMFESRGWLRCVGAQVGFDMLGSEHS